MKRWFLALTAVVALSGQTAQGGAFGGPSITVYPFLGGSGVGSDTGSKLAVAIAARLQTKKDLSVLLPTAGSPREKFLENARAIGADYYVTGYVTPLGDDVNLVVQLVNTTTGILVWSDSASVRTFGEAAAQADQIHDVVIARSGTTLEHIAVPTPSPKPPPGLAPGPTFPPH
jgi:TolB-like protein